MDKLKGKREVITAAVVGAVASLVAARLLGYFAPRLIERCVSQDSFQCLFDTIKYIEVGALATAFGCNYALLRLGRVKRAAVIAALAVPTATALASWLFVWTGLRLGLAHVGFALPLANVGWVLLLPRITDRRLLTPLASLAAALALLPVTPVLANAVASRTAHDDSAQYHRKQRSELAKTDFVVYVPTFRPPGYKQNSVVFHKAYASDDRPYVDTQLLYGNNVIPDPAPFTVRSYRQPVWFDPPANCGNETPRGDYPRPCSEWGRTAKGDTVYEGQSRAINRRDFFVSIDNTVVSLSTDTPPRGLRDDELKRVFDSLRPYKP